MQGRVDGDDGRLVAIKVFSSCEDSVAASKAEASIYSHLQDLQGVVIPTCLGTGQVPLTGTGLLLMSLVVGRPLSSLSIDCLDARTRKEVGEAAMQSLTLIHKRGVAHGDIRLANILYLDKKESRSLKGEDLDSTISPIVATPSRIMILDFGRSFLAGKKTLQVEMQQLDSLLSSWIKL